MNQTYYLPARKLRLRQRDDGSLLMNLDGQSIELAQPKRALPLSDPDRYIVLTDTDGNELGVVRDLAELEPTSREILQEALKRAYVLVTITRILEVEKDALTGQTRWRVEVAVDRDSDSEDEWHTPGSGKATSALTDSDRDTDGGHDHSDKNGAESKDISNIRHNLNKIRLFRNKDKEQEKEQEGDGTMSAFTSEEREFLINGQEDVQTARYPHIYIVDTDRNRYEIINCEELDIESRRAAERYF